MEKNYSDNNSNNNNNNNKKNYSNYYTNTSVTNNCKCVECTTSYVMDNEYKRDLQSLVLKFCRSIFSSIQEGSTIIIIRSIEQKMFHGDINSKQDLEQIINIFKIINNSSNNSNCIHNNSNNNSSSKYLLPCITSNFAWTTSNIVFEWNFNDQACIIDHILLKISKRWYSPFIDYLCKVDRWQRNSWGIISTTISGANGGGSYGGMFLNVIESCLAGFKYLYDFHWNLMDDDMLGLYNEKGVFLLASECGVFIIILVKPQIGKSNSSRGRRTRKNTRKRKLMVSEGEDNEVEMKTDEDEDEDYNGDGEEDDDLTEYYNRLVEDYKAYAIKKHGNKLLTVIGATFNDYSYYDDDEEEEEEEEEVYGEEEEGEREKEQFGNRQGYGNDANNNNKSRNKKARLMIKDNKYVDPIKFVSETDYSIAKSVKNWYENKVSQLSFKDSIKMTSSSSYPYINKYAPATTTWTQKQTELQAGY